MKATLAAAEAERSSVILGIGGLSANRVWLRRTGIDTYGDVCRRLATHAEVPCAVLFNEADSREEAEPRSAAPTTP